MRANENGSDGTKGCKKKSYCEYAQEKSDAEIEARQAAKEAAKVAKEAAKNGGGTETPTPTGTPTVTGTPTATSTPTIIPTSCIPVPGVQQIHLHLLRYLQAPLPPHTHLLMMPSYLE